MELRQLRHFIAVLEHGSLGDAARILDMSQPALTKSIQALERSLGAPLFDRSSHGMKPTSFAQSLELRARVIAAEAGRAREDFDQLSGSKRGLIKIGSTPGASLSILPKALARFTRTHPHVEISVTETLAHELVRRVQTGEIEFALVGVAAASGDDSLGTEVLLPGQRAVVVAAAHHPLAAHRQLALKDIWQGPWLLQRTPDVLRRELTGFFQRAGLPPPIAAIEHDSAVLAKRLLIEGRFLAYVSELYVRDEIAARRLRILPVEGIERVWDVGFVFRRESPMTPAATKLVESIRAVCARRPRH